MLDITRRKFCITIDSREPAWIKEWLPTQFPEYKFVVEKLEEGDYQCGCVLVERKTWRDLYSSAYNDKGERLDTQRMRLITHQEDKIVCFLITEDLDEYLVKTKMAKKFINVEAIREFLESTVASLMSRDNFRIICGAHEKGALRTMVRMMYKIEVMQDLNIPCMRNPDAHMAKLLDIPLSLWLNIKETHGSSMTHLCSLKESDYTKVKGCGKARAKKIVCNLRNGF